MTARAVPRAARLGVVLAIVGGLILVVAGPARACSCATGDPRDRLADAAAAFVGEMLTRDGDDLVFAVTTSVKGDLGEEIRIFSPAAQIGGACGLETSPGRRVGLLLYEGSDGELTANLCTTIDPDELLRAAGPLPEPDGSGPVRFLIGGSFGAARMLALDEQGRTLAYGSGDGYVIQVAVCPRARFSVEVAIDAIAGMKGGQVTLAVRDLATFEIVRELPLAPDSREAGAIRCRDADATSSLIGTRTGLVAVEGDEVSTLYTGSFDDADLTPTVAYGIDHGRVVAVDPATDEGRVIATVPPRFAGISVSPDGSRVAGTLRGHPAEEPMSVVVADIPTNPGHLAFRTAALEGWNEGGDVVWIDDERLAYLPGGGDHDIAHVYDATSMRELGRFDGWYSADGAVLERVAFGVGWGTLLRADLPDGPAEELSRLGSPDTFAFALVVPYVVVRPNVPVPGAAAPLGVDVVPATVPTSETGGAVPIVLGLAAVAVALAVIGQRVIRSRR